MYVNSLNLLGITIASYMIPFIYDKRLLALVSGGSCESAAEKATAHNQIIKSGFFCFQTIRSMQSEMGFC